MSPASMNTDAINTRVFREPTMSTSFSSLGETQDSAANTSENDDFTPSPITSRYESMKALRGVLLDAIGAHQNISMNDDDSPPVKWANAVTDALYNDDGNLGKRQSDLSYTVDEFKDAFGDTIATPHDDLTDGERTELKTLLGNSENHDAEDVSGEFKFPVVNGERLPLLVADEDALAAGMDLLDAMMDELDNDAGSTTDAVESDDSGPTRVSTFTVASLKDYIKDVDDEQEIRGMLNDEQEGDERKTAIAALESRLADFETDETDEQDDNETASDDGAGSTTDGISDEEVEAALKVLQSALTSN